jgi:hypothetical protein
MVARAYLLLDILKGDVEKAVQALQSNSGVTRIDLLEGSPNLFVIINASGQKRLTDLTLRAFASVKELAGDVRLLPVKEQSFDINDSERDRLGQTAGAKKAR